MTISYQQQGKEPIKADRAGFSIWAISDELFSRMKEGNTYKDDCIVPREDLRYIRALHKDNEEPVTLQQPFVSFF